MTKKIILTLAFCIVLFDFVFLFPFLAQAQQSQQQLSSSGCSREWILRPGLYSPKIKFLQQILKLDKNIYPEGLVTGYYGYLTKKAVLRLQKKFGLKQTGIVDEQTAAVVFPCNYKATILFPAKDKVLLTNHSYYIIWMSENIPPFLLGLPRAVHDFPNIYTFSLNLINESNHQKQLLGETTLRNYVYNWQIKRNVLPGRYRISLSIKSNFNNGNDFFSDLFEVKDEFQLSQPTQPSKLLPQPQLFSTSQNLLPPTVDIKVNNFDDSVSFDLPQTVTLSWSSQGADSCIASGDWAGPKASSGSYSIDLTLGGTYYYIITCSNVSGSSSDLVIVNVKEKPVLRLNSDSLNIEVGKSASVRAYYDPDGSSLPKLEYEVTTSSVWRSYDNSVASVDNGVVKGNAIGSTLVEVEYGEISKAILVNVVGLQTEQAWGWDYNLTQRCVKSTNPNAENYYSDTSGCLVPNKNWTVAVQSEKALGASCPGVVNQSLPINQPNGPLSLKFVPHVDEFGRKNWSVNLTTNLSNNSHPCGEGYFTWFVLMDHIAHGGGPFPRPDEIAFSATVNFNDFTPNGATRAIVGWQGWWDGKARSIEITFQGSGWGDNYPSEPDVFNYINNSSLEYVSLDGKVWGITAPKLVDTVIKVNWSEIIKNLVSRGFLQAPSNGWEKTQTTAVYIGHESNNFAVSNSVVSSLWVTNFRIRKSIDALFRP